MNQTFYVVRVGGSYSRVHEGALVFSRTLLGARKFTSCAEATTAYSAWATFEATIPPSRRKQVGIVRVTFDEVVSS